MEILFDPLKDQLISLTFSFVLVFVAGIAFGYLSGAADRKTKTPEFKKRTPEETRRPSSIYDFNKKQ